MTKGSPTQKIVNQAGFIKAQMEDFVVKLEEAELFGDAEKLESILEEYSEFMTNTVKGLSSGVNHE